MNRNRDKGRTRERGKGGGENVRGRFRIFHPWISSLATGDNLVCSKIAVHLLQPSTEMN